MQICLKSLNAFLQEANIDLIYSSARSEGKTDALEILVYGQGSPRRVIPFLYLWGDKFFFHSTVQPS